ncbi:MAG: hypothetical protein M3R16_01830 [Pseudomonadota bacterium]|nr:hypothetical protein [Pseudomonadota bacterium]
MLTPDSSTFPMLYRVTDPRDAKQRIEPGFGWLEGIDFRKSGNPRKSRAFIHSGWPLWTGIAITALILLVIVFRQPLADRLYPENRIQALQKQATQAMAQGRLTASDGSGARELYEAALALDPDRNEAMHGLMRVAESAMVQARAAVTRNRFKEAHSALQLARDLSAPRSKTDAIAIALRKREAEHADIENLLATATAAHRAGRLDGGDNAALPLYQRIIALEPEHDRALEGREDALADLLQQARKQLEQNRLGDAAVMVKAVRDYDTGHVGLPEAQAQLVRAAEREKRRAVQALKRNRPQVALQAWRAVLHALPDDVDAQAGIERTAVHYAQQSERMASDFRLVEAEAALRHARQINSQAPAVRTAQAHLQRVRRLQSRTTALSPTRAQQRRVARLLVEAAEAEARGDWLTPPGESAYDKLRAAQSIAPASAEVKRAAARVLPATRRCYEDELRSNRLRRASVCLDAWQQLAPADQRILDGKRRLAQRWIAVGAERLGAGEIAFASQALASARALDPKAEGLREFSERVATASGNAP